MKYLFVVVCLAVLSQSIMSQSPPVLPGTVVIPGLTVPQCQQCMILFNINIIQ